MLAHFSAPELLLPEAEGRPPSEPLGRGERMWLTEDCLLRYLRANSWVLQSTCDLYGCNLPWRASADDPCRVCSYQRPSQS